MKTKIPVLIAAGLFLCMVTKAQYGPPCPDNRVVVQGRLVIPAPPVVVFPFGFAAPVRYEERYRNNDYAYYNGDWRAAAYDRYCREQRGYRMSREEFYRDRCDERGNPHYKHKKGGYGY